MTSKTYEQKLNDFNKYQLLSYIMSGIFVFGKHAEPYFVDIFQEFILKQPTPILKECVNRMIDCLEPGSQYYIKHTNPRYRPMIDLLQKTITYNELIEKIDNIPVNQPLGKTFKI